MNYPQSQQILEEIKKSKKILLNCHRSPDPDSFGSALSMYYVLISLGKDVEIICPDNLDSELLSLTDSHLVKKIDFKKFDFSKFDLFIVMDSGSWGMVSGDKGIKIPDIKIILIDHHKTNDKFGQINLVDEAASSDCEVLYKLYEDWKINIDKKIATALLAGILGDTVILKFATPFALKISAKLIDKGAPRDELIYKLFSSRKFDELKMWGEFLTRMELDKVHRFVWSAVSYDVYKNYERTDPNSSAATVFGQTVVDTDFSMIMLEKEKKKLSISFRSRGNFDISGLAVELGGGGHKAAAGGQVVGLPFEKAVEKVLTVAREYANKHKKTS